MRKKRLPNFQYENNLWRMGFNNVAGVDEVGRGSFAGPVVASAVALAPMTNVQFPIFNKIGEKVIVNDSKQLTAKQRQLASSWITENATTWGIGESSVAEINRLGMGKATKMAFRRAVGNANKRLNNRVDYLLIDAFYIPYIRGFPVARKNVRKNENLNDSRSRQLAIVKGDEESFSIAAASIIAKVYRDELMVKLSGWKSYKSYGWQSNKGYGTRLHQKAIRKHGITRHHRRQFVETFLSKK